MGEEDERLIKKCLRDIRDGAPVDVMSGEVLCEVSASLIPRIQTVASKQLGVEVAAFENDLIVDPTSKPADQDLVVAVDREGFERVNAAILEEGTKMCMDAFQALSDAEAYGGSELCWVDALLAPVILERLGNLPVTMMEGEEGAESVLLVVDEEAYPAYKRIHQNLYQ